MCVCVCACVWGGGGWWVSVFQHYAYQHFLVGITKAIAISWLMLTTITRLDSVCQVQDATWWYHLTHTILCLCWGLMYKFHRDTLRTRTALAGWLLCQVQMLLWDLQCVPCFLCCFAMTIASKPGVHLWSASVTKVGVTYT